MAPEVIIDPGHGGTQAYGGSSPLGVGAEEKHVNFELARRVAARLGSVAQMTRTGDVNVPLRERAQLAARAGARALVSIHANAGAQGLRGSEVWVHDRHDAGSVELAQAIHDSLDRVGPTRGLYQGPLTVLDPAVLGGTAACLIEADYLSDPHGHSRLTSERGLDELAAAIASGVRSYLRRDHQYGDGSESFEYTVPDSVPMLRQPNAMACWATVTTMLMGWRDGAPWAIADALQSIGDEWSQLFADGRGLLGRDKQRFLDQAGLIAMPPANYDGRGWLQLLEQFGPLWVTGDVDPSENFAIHARIMIHIHGDGSRDGTTLWLIDPATGNRTEPTLGEFMDQYESEAATQGRALRIQVVHWPAGAQRSSSQAARGLDQTWYSLREQRFEIHGAGQSAASFSVHVPPAADPNQRYAVTLAGDLRVHTANPLTLRAVLSDPFADALADGEQSRMLEAGFQGGFFFEWTGIRPDRDYLVSLSTPDLSAHITGNLRVHAVL